MCFSRLLLSSKDIGIYGKRAGTKLTHKGGRGAFCVRKGHTPCHSCVLCQGAVMKARLHRRLLCSLDCWLVQIGEGINSHEKRRMVRCTVTGSTAESTEGHKNITSLLTFSSLRSNLAHPPGLPEVEEGVTGNWVTFTCLYRNDNTHQPPKAGVTPSTLDPPSSHVHPTTHLQGVTERSLVLVVSSFLPGPPEKSQQSLQFPVQCLFGRKKGLVGRGVKKGPHSQTVWVG